MISLCVFIFNRDLLISLWKTPANLKLFLKVRFFHNLFSQHLLIKFERSTVFCKQSVSFAVFYWFNFYKSFNSVFSLLSTFFQLSFRFLHFYIFHFLFSLTPALSGLSLRPPSVFLGFFEFTAMITATGQFLHLRVVLYAINYFHEVRNISCFLGSLW